MKVLKIIVGILVTILGIVGFIWPAMFTAVAGYVACTVAGIIGVIAIIDYFVSKSKAKRSGVQFAGGAAAVVAGILGIILCICNIINPAVSVAFTGFFSLFVVISILVDGIMMIIGAFTREYDTAVRVLNVILGILIVLAAGTALSISFIGTFAVTGVFLSIAFIIAGISLIAAAPTKDGTAPEVA